MSCWQDEFDPGWGVPQEIIDMVGRGEAEDLSWHNDEMPCFGIADDDGNVMVRIWVDHVDEDLRCGDGDRYCVEYFRKGPNEESEVTLTNSLEEALVTYGDARRAYLATVTALP